MMGAYSNALKTGFNGVPSEKLAIRSEGGWYLGGQGRSGTDEPRRIAA
jgi:hypothetical protein